MHKLLESLQTPLLKYKVKNVCHSRTSNIGNQKKSPIARKPQKSALFGRQVCPTESFFLSLNQKSVGKKKVGHYSRFVVKIKIELWVT